MKKLSKFSIKKRLRLKNFDYSNQGAYFITICTKNRIPFFDADNDHAINRMPTVTGKTIAENIWQLIPVQFPFVKLSNFVVMPDHMHGIIIIKKPVDNDSMDYGGVGHVINHMATEEMATKPGGFAGQKNPMLHKNLSTIIRWYKGRCSFEIRKHIPDFAWQSLFYDHIIRDAVSFRRIQKYIDDNPKKLQKSKY